MYNYFNESSRLLNKELMKLRSDIKINLDAPDGDIFSKYSDDFSNDSDSEDERISSRGKHYYYKRVNGRMKRFEYMPINICKCKYIVFIH